MTILAPTALGIALILTVQAVYRRTVGAVDRALRGALGDGGTRI